MSLESSYTTPVPYQPGTSLEIEVLEDCHCNLPFPRTFTAFISEMFSMTMSPVLDVTINTKSNSDFRAVLKLYDRRFGTTLRRILGKHKPHTPADEAVFQSFIQRGDIVPILHELEEERKTALIGPEAWHHVDDTPEGRARYEASLWQECNEHFDTETKAYARLKDLQGKSIPRMYAHVRVMVPNPDEPYSEIKGILLEVIPGYKLWDLSTSPLAPSDPKLWSGIVQSAVDAAHDINKRGIIMNDCGPRNVVVDKNSQCPFIIDLAHCGFKDRLIEEWTRAEEEGEGEQDWVPEVEYWVSVRGCDNSGAIGAVMTTRVLRENGWKLDIRYPDCERMIDEVRAVRLDR
ncbi:hypothetical protein FZEAL_944 [Fusarium zealandicum]|uniref:Protein kinase domain-containing protein n=1 Tax=Fusarium zealandicum TaxID=1053134 RepID=A0A8H4UTT8_9HYPO|nr:hypothetical protein FZEAL_944 [Fusarium zealandicum]